LGLTGIAFGAQGARYVGLASRVNSSKSRRNVDNACPSRPAPP
jgi:hypothetical protein